MAAQVYTSDTETWLKRPAVNVTEIPSPGDECTPCSRDPRREDGVDKIGLRAKQEEEKDHRRSHDMRCWERMGIHDARQTLHRRVAMPNE